jgi:hypothetical protein
MFLYIGENFPITSESTAAPRVQPTCVETTKHMLRTREQEDSIADTYLT